MWLNNHHQRNPFPNDTHQVELGATEKKRDKTHPWYILSVVKTSPSSIHTTLKNAALYPLIKHPPHKILALSKQRCSFQENEETRAF